MLQNNNLYRSTVHHFILVFKQNTSEVNSFGSPKNRFWMIAWYAYCSKTFPFNPATSNQIFRIENLNPIAIWITNECQSLHATLVWFLDEFHAQFFEALTSGIHIGHQNANVAKTARLLVASVINLSGLCLSAPVMRQFHGSLQVNRITTNKSW